MDASIGVNQDPFGGEALGAVAGYGAAVVEDCQRNSLSASKFQCPWFCRRESGLAKPPPHGTRSSNRTAAAQGKRRIHADTFRPAVCKSQAEMDRLFKILEWLPTKGADCVALDNGRYWRNYFVDGRALRRMAAWLEIWVPRWMGRRDKAASRRAGMTLNLSPEEERRPK